MADRLTLQFAAIRPPLSLQWAMPGKPLPAIAPTAPLPSIPVIVGPGGPPGPEGPPGDGAQDPGDLTLIFNNKLI